MSSPTSDLDPRADDTDAGATEPTATSGRSSMQDVTATTRAMLENSRQRVLATGAVGTLAIGVLLGLRVLYNVPFDPVVFPSAVLKAVGTASTILVALALVVTAVSSRNAAVRVGLLFVGVFGAVAAFVDAAVVPGVVGVTAGGLLALGGALGRPASARGVRRRLVAVGFLVAVGVTLTSMTGVLDVGGRSTGTVLYLGALTLLAVRTHGDRVALAVGGLAALLVVAASLAAPYAVGSALLLGFGVVGGPHLLAATAVFGAVAAAVAGQRRAAPAVVVGALLLAFAGVPSTPTAAMAVLLGVTFACVALDELGIEQPAIDDTAIDDTAIDDAATSETAGRPREGTDR